MNNHEVPPVPIFNPDGSINEKVLKHEYGLEAEEASQEVVFGSYKGTVAEMLGDRRCPVGEMVRSAYKQTGLAGVVGQFEALSAMDPNFQVEIKQQITDMDQVKKK